MGGCSCFPYVVLTPFSLKPQAQAKTDCHIMMYFGMHFLQNDLPKMNWMNRLTIKFGPWQKSSQEK